MIRRPPRSTLFPTRRSSDLADHGRALPDAPQRLAEIAAAAHERHAEGELVDVEVFVGRDRKSTRLNSSHLVISYAVFCLKKKNILKAMPMRRQEPLDDVDVG